MLLGASGCRIHHLGFRMLFLPPLCNLMKENPTILLVDDLKNDVFLMRTAFKKAGFDIPLQDVQNGEEAIERN